MLFAHDTEVALTAAAALVNTGRGTEQLPDGAALDHFVAAWEWTGERTHDRAELDARCDGAELGGLTPSEEEARQWRTARAAILLMGDSGVRRDETAHARRAGEPRRRKAPDRP